MTGTAAPPRAVRVKATTVAARIAYVEQRLGGEALARFRAEASPALRPYLTGGAPTGWAPFDVFVEANVLADRLFGAGDLALAWEMGRFAATHNMGVWKAFVYRHVQPSLVMSIAAGLWGQHYDGGRLATRPLGASGVAVSIIDFPTPHRAHCLSVGGWILGTAEAGPRRSATVREASCRLRGDRICELHATWVQ